MSRPLLLLDVDGVLNAVGGSESQRAVWPQWRRGTATADGTGWAITFAPAVVARIKAWHGEGRAEVQWLTTWGHDANGELRDLLGLPHLVVAGTYGDQDQGATTGTGGGHAAVTPSAPDPLSGRWWKYDVVSRLLAEDPARLLIWVDDELKPGTSYRTWADQQPLVRPCGPDPGVGLSPSDLDALELHLAPPMAREVCAGCGADTAPVVYGFPGGDLQGAAERGEIALGGCVVWDGRPTQRCTACGADDATAGPAPW